ncbi:hypothetical protein QN224_30430 [Sinorhizobium sp. 8-89]|nr:hypothetical protein [Sinorhizobium sp. 7-81]MDK1389680.1 hypothetical protein [Sinorhizobium sp. 7-81]
MIGLSDREVSRWELFRRQALAALRQVAKGKEGRWQPFLTMPMLAAI